MAENSRVFVSGLPPSLSNDELRKHFSSKFQVTDAHVIPKRRIGFVGFKDQTGAQNAVDYFNRTYIRMSKIAVQIARPVDAEPPPAKSKFKNSHSSDEKPSDGVASNPSLKRKREQVEKDEDPKLREYLSAMQPAMKSRTWANDGAVEVVYASSAEKSLTDPAQTNGHDIEHAESQKKKLKQGAHVSADHSGPAESQIGIRSQEEQQSDEQEASDPANQPKTDEEWLRSRTSRLLGLIDEDEEEPAVVSAQRPLLEQSPESNHDEVQKQEPVQPTQEDTQTQFDRKLDRKDDDANKDMIRDTGRLFVRNLPYDASEGDLEPLFAPFGKIEELHVAYDTRHSTSKGFAYVQYFDPDAAILAYEQLDGKTFQGRLLHVLPASSKKTYKLDEYEISKLPLKKQQQIKRKAEAASSTFSWNSLYMNTDAVMASVAERLGVSKSDLLEPTSSDAAVKQAHAETHVIQETKAYFTANGVNLDSFKQRDRGNTAILVKNFSYGVKATDLKSLFEPFGQIVRLLMPPSGTIAIVQFSMPDEAQKAFKALAYRKLGESILFLEKAPKDLFTGAPTAAGAAQDANVVSQKFSTSDAFKADDADAAPPTSTLFIRNLNFSTTTAGLAEVFQPLDGFLSARVKTKQDPKKPGETLSMGFGFVEFRTSAQAQAALAAMNGYKLDQHELVVRASHKGMDAAEERRKEDTAKKLSARRTKIIIKNLPFQATKKDVRSLFGAYGQLRSVRVPKKFDRTSRGFAFADFVSAREAENAMDALKNTHLLGRKLVLEFGSEEAIDAEEEIQKIERKVDAQVNRVKMQQLTGTGRRKFNVDAGADDEG